MKTEMMRAVAAAILAAPIGWILGGMLAAASLHPYQYAVSMQASGERPLYVPGSYGGPALIAALVIGGAVYLWELSRRGR